MIQKLQRPQMRWIRRGLLVALLLLLLQVGVALFEPTPVALASDSCIGGCSETVNQSNGSVIVARRWCGDNSTIYSNNPPCGAGTQTKVLYAGQQTPDNEDWDGVRIDKGWRYTYQICDYFLCSSVSSYDNRNGSTHVWIQVHNYQTFYVKKICYKTYC